MNQQELTNDSLRSSLGIMKKSLSLMNCRLRTQLTAPSTIKNITIYQLITLRANAQKRFFYHIKQPLYAKCVEIVNPIFEPTFSSDEGIFQSCPYVTNELEPFTAPISMDFELMVRSKICPKTGTAAQWRKETVSQVELPLIIPLSHSEHPMCISDPLTKINLQQASTKDPLFSSFTENIITRIVQKKILENAFQCNSMLI
jgi:hypothetical protein